MCLCDFDVDLPYGLNGLLFSTIEAALAPSYAKSCGVAFLQVRVVTSELGYDIHGHVRRRGPRLGYLDGAALTGGPIFPDAGTMFCCFDTIRPAKPEVAPRLVPAELRFLSVAAPPLRNVFYWEQYYHEFCNMHPGVSTLQ